MPSPPRKNETQKKFVNRAVADFIREGYPRLRAVAAAFSMWRRRNKQKK